MTQVKKYRTKLNIIEAIQYTGENIGEIKAFVGDDFCDKAKDRFYYSWSTRQVLHLRTRYV